MSATLELFERFKQSIRARTDSAGALALGVKSQTASNWRSRGSQAEPRLIEAMCIALREDIAPWLLRVQMEQASDASNRQVWRRVGEKLGYPMTGIAAVLYLSACPSCCAEASLVHAVRIFARMWEWADPVITA